MRVTQQSFEILQMPEGETALAILERIGRTAYKSEDAIHPGVWNAEESRWEVEPTSHKFVRKIMKAEREVQIAKLLSELRSEELNEATLSDMAKRVLRYMKHNPAHESVIEHCSATVLFVTNRGVTHELVRHRLCSYTQESTRYVAYNKEKYGGQITVVNRECTADQRETWEQAMLHAERAYMTLTAAGMPPQLARDVLPHAVKADIWCTANFRQWRTVFDQRTAPAAHPDMQALMGALLEEFQKRVPIIFEV